MGPFKKCVTCIMAIFTPFNFIILCRFHSTPSFVSFTKNLLNERQEAFYIYGCFSISRYINGGRK